MNAWSKLTRFSKTILIISVILLIGQIVSAAVSAEEVVLEHLAFLIFENLLMILFVFVPPFFGLAAKFQVPKSLEIAFISFCFSALILGDLFDFYGRFVWWDTMLHGLSGIMLGIIGYMAVYALKNAGISLPPIFVSIWIICFSLALGAFWERCEYVFDGMFGLNSQEFLAGSSTFYESIPREGREALKDTMDDLILDFVGAGIISVSSLIATKHHITDRHQENENINCM